MNKVTCVQCRRMLKHVINEPKITCNIFVCHYPDCPNYGLLSICQEKMPDEVKK